MPESPPGAPCEVLISSGRVSVDGVIVTEAGVRVDPATQEIRVDNARVLTDPDVVTVMLHKRPVW